MSAKAPAPSNVWRMICRKSVKQPLKTDGKYKMNKLVPKKPQTNKNTQPIGLYSSEKHRISRLPCCIKQWKISNLFCICQFSNQETFNSRTCMPRPLRTEQGREFRETSLFIPECLFASLLPKTSPLLSSKFQNYLSALPH